MRQESDPLWARQYKTVITSYSIHYTKLYELNMEYPVKAGVPTSELVNSWGDFKADALPLAEVAKHRQAAQALMDEVKFDL